MMTKTKMTTTNGNDEPMKPVKIADGLYECPVCGRQYINYAFESVNINRCTACNQKLDWSDER